MRWRHRALALTLTAAVWVPALTPAASAASVCDRIVTFEAGPDGLASTVSDTPVLDLTETSGLVSFVLIDPSWVITTAAVRFTTTGGVDGTQIGGQQLVAAPGPHGVLATGDTFEFCLEANVAGRSGRAAEVVTDDPAPHRTRARIIAL